MDILVREMRSSNEHIEKALIAFREFLRENKFDLSRDAAASLREYVMEKERKERILFQLRRREKTSEDLIVGFRKLAKTASEIALLQGRTYVTYHDIDKARKKIFCKVWPFCK